MFIDLLHWTKSLDILLFAHSFATQEVPSWVIDWRDSDANWVLLLYYRAPSSFLAGIKFEKCKGATPGSKSEWNITGEKKLEVSGVPIGRISFCSWHAEPEETEPNEQTDEVEEEAQDREETEDRGEAQETGDTEEGEVTEEAEEVEERSESGENGGTEESEHSEHSGGTQYSHYCPSYRVASHFRDAIGSLELSRMEEMMAELITITDNFSPAKPRSLRASAEWCRIMYESRDKGMHWAFKKLDKKYLTDELAEHIERLDRVIIRCSGQYEGFGITSRGAREGDMVALISGVSMPMVLREDNGSFKVIGPALIGGVMNGQLWTDEMAKSLETMVLV